MTTAFKYDSDRNCLEETPCPGESNCEQGTRFIYDDYGNLIEEYMGFFDDGGNIKSFTRSGLPFLEYKTMIQYEYYSE